MKAVRQLLAMTACVSVFFAGAALAADAPQAEAKAPAKDLVQKGDAKCTSCHDEADDTKPTILDLKPSVLAIGKTKHGTVADSRAPTCTDCHGESEKHVKHKGSDKPPKADFTFGKNAKTTVEARNNTCLNCHQGGKHMNWQSSTHANRDVACTSCHKLHAAKDKVREKATQAEVCFTCHKEQRAQLNKPSHHPVIEGKMACTSCHDLHGDNPKALIKSSTNDTCFMCHMEKRGPFVHNHQPVTEDCTICHNPHGTNIGNLLKARPPFLCQECHNHDGHPGQSAGLPNTRTASGTGTLGTVGRGCLNCHTNIHGGNSTQNSATAGRFRR